MPPTIISTKICTVCHNKSTQKTSSVIVHPFVTGPSGIIDLEGRPKELTEFILNRILEVCPHCGYIAEDIGEKTSVTRELLQSLEYISLYNSELPISPSLFLRAAYILLAENKPKKAINNYIFAAWCADSIFHPDLAISCRKIALSLIFSGNKTFDDIPSEKWVSIIDTIRRSKDFPAVITYCNTLIPISDLIQRQELEFELSCAKKGDNGQHTTLDVSNANSCNVRQYETHEELIIGGRSYYVEEDCYGVGWSWETKTRTLTLSNYHGSAIKAYGDITLNITQIDNQIQSSHGAGIHIFQGNLRVTGHAFLSIQGEEQGILVKTGTLEIASSGFIIRTLGDGIVAYGDISITNGSVLDVHSHNKAIQSLSGGLISTNRCVLKLKGDQVGIDLAEGFQSSTGGYNQIESSEGHGIIIHNGSLELSECILDIACGGTSICLKNGNLYCNTMRGSMNGSSGVHVTGSVNISNSVIQTSGEDHGIFVSKDLEITGVNIESHGTVGIATGGDLHITKASITASGETGISVGGNLDYVGINMILSGDTALKVTGYANISEGFILANGKICGAEVHGNYSQANGTITFSGEAEDGMRILGEYMRVFGGSLTATGRKTGIFVAETVLIEKTTFLSASGDIGFSVGYSLNINGGVLKVSGEEIGLCVRSGNLITGSGVGLTATGNVGIYTLDDIGIHGSTLEITGQFGGIVTEKGSLNLTGATLEITADEYGILLQSGSMYLISGFITITNSRMTDSGGSGIVIEKGNLKTESLMTITGESYGLSVPCGEIQITFGKNEVYGYRAGITAESLVLENANLTAYGKIEGAVILTKDKRWKGDNIIFLAGKSATTANEDVYSGQRFVHAYTRS
ncbi:MAG: hypothetical protein LUQ50_01280 [Methanospirillum sp.]|uniref:hypothetical protein n=1 Tax=Methanospirillum sp. TaxID=45200 RepID=UPI0023702FB2|nr:hypothetical protein [Methanospirillum sp.]MDD1727684.1 hypothetical protein [Methanospirillum sp.]